MLQSHTLKLQRVLFWNQ